jgi:enoyl-CoA hydratase/carnithine racemase
LARAYAAYDADDDLRAVVRFGHGEDFTRGIDVDAFAEALRTGTTRPMPTASIRWDGMPS